MARVDAVACEAGAVREQLGERRLGNLSMEPCDIFADRIVKPASLSGYVYDDANNDGLRAGEVGLSGLSLIHI